VTPVPAVRRAWWRPRLDGATTPARLRLLLALLILLSLAWGVLAALTADQHASAAADVVAVSEPLSLDAEQIYTSLSDADATAASAFLAGGLEPTVARQHYQADITEAAIRIANDTEYGLSAGVWSTDNERALDVAAQIEAGTVWINCYNIFDAALPFGGYKQSGWGREMGHDVLELYTEVKAVCAAL